MAEKKMPICTTFLMEDLPENFQDWARRMKQISPGAHVPKNSNRKTDYYRFSAHFGWRRFLSVFSWIVAIVATIFVWSQIKSDFRFAFYQTAFWDSSKYPIVLLCGAGWIGLWSTILLSLFVKIQSPFGHYIYVTPEFLFEVHFNRVHVYSLGFVTQITADLLQSNSVVTFYIGRKRFRLLFAGWHYASSFAKQMKTWVQLASGSPEALLKMDDERNSINEDVPQNPPPFSLELMVNKPKRGRRFHLLWKMMIWSYPMIIALMAARFLDTSFIPFHNRQVCKSMFHLCKTEKSCPYHLLWANKEFEQQMDDFWFQAILKRYSQLQSSSIDTKDAEKELLQLIIARYQDLFPQGKYLNDLKTFKQK